MQIGCCALYCTHSCQAYAAYLFMLDFTKSIHFSLGKVRPSELFGQMRLIPTSSNLLRVVTQWLVYTTCQWGYMGLSWTSISPPWVCFALYAWNFWCGCVQYFCWVRMAWQEQAAIVLFMLWRGSCNPIWKGLLSWWHVSWYIPPDFVQRNKSALLTSICMHGTEGVLYGRHFVWFGPSGMVHRGSHASQASA